MVWLEWWSNWGKINLDLFCTHSIQIMIVIIIYDCNLTLNSPIGESWLKVLYCILSEVVSVYKAISCRSRFRQLSGLATQASSNLEIYVKGPTTQELSLVVMLCYAYLVMSFNALRCHAVQCHVMPCHAMPCHAMSYNAKSCPAMTYHGNGAMQYHVLSRWAIPWRTVLCHVEQLHVIPCRGKLRNAMSCLHGYPCHVMSCHTMTYRTLSSYYFLLRVVLFCYGIQNYVM